MVHWPEKLTRKEMVLLREVVLKRSPKHMGLVEVLEKGELLAPDQAEELVNIVFAEFCETGLNPDDEPNARGLLLDTLMAKLDSLHGEW